MKICNALFLVACVLVSISGYGQKVSITEKDARIEKLFKEIRKQTGFQFLYTNKLVEHAKRVTIDVKDATLEDVLSHCFEKQPFTYEIKNKTIIVKSKPAGSPEPGNKPDPPKEIQGRLTNEKGEPISGATIHVDGTALTASTSPDGAFSLKGVHDNAILKVSHIQYDDIIIPLKGKTFVDAMMVTKVSSLDELQVIGYGTVSRRLNTGDVYTIKAKDIEKQPVNNPLQALQGRVPGVDIVQESGVPGGSFNVLIRGRNSLLNGNDPLYIIDGVPYSSQIIPIASGGAIATGVSIGIKNPSPLNYINVNDIESIEVLKDADATAIYGSRGANGVILITTKKGKTGKATVNINVQTGVSQVAHKVKMLNTEQYLDYRNEAFTNDGLTPGPFDYDLNGGWEKNRYTGWQELLIGKNAGYTDAQGTVSGGNADVQYLIGAGYHNERAVFPADFGLKKGSFHVALSTASQNKKLKILLKAGYITSLNRLPASDMMEFTKWYPNAPEVFDANGNLNWQNNSWLNPYNNFLSNSKVNTKTLLSNGVVSYELMPGLEIKANTGFTELQFNDIAIVPSTANRPDFNVTTGRSTFSYNTTRSWSVEPQLEYKLSFSGVRIEALVGASLQENRSTGMVINATGYNDNSLLESLAGATTISKGKIYDQVYRYNSGFGRIRLNRADKYILHFTGRRDGSSRFGPANRFANFGSAGAAWLFSNENFIKNKLSLISFGKIRASYGITGSDQIGDYRYLDLYNYLNGNGYNLPYQNSTALFPNRLYTPDLAWEETKKVEAGLEIGLAKDRFFFSAAYFRNRSSNQLVTRPLPDITGFNGVTINLPAVIENAGWEFIAKTHNISTRDISWVSTINFTKQANKLLELPGLSKSPYVNLFVIGQPITIQQVYHYTGVDPQTGLYSFKDAKGNAFSAPTFDMADRYILVNIDPKFTGGFQNTITWKNVEVDFFFQFVKQMARNPLFVNSVQPGGFDFVTPFNWPVEILNNRWRKPGDDATIQKFSTDFRAPFDAYTTAVDSDLGWVDASFIRLKNASISYRLPEAWVKKIRVQNARLYIQGQNLFTITPYDGIDPENAPRDAGLSLPPLRVFTGGIQVNL